MKFSRSLPKLALACFAVAIAAPALSQTERPIDREPDLPIMEDEKEIEASLKQGVTIEQFIELLGTVTSQYNAEYRTRVQARIAKRHDHKVGLSGTEKWFYSEPFRNKIMKVTRRSGAVSYLVSPDIFFSITRHGYNRSVAMTIFSTVAQPQAMRRANHYYVVGLPTGEPIFPTDEVKITNADLSVIDQGISVRKVFYTSGGNRLCFYQEYTTMYLPKRFNSELPWLRKLGMVGSNYIGGREQAAPVVCEYEVRKPNAPSETVIYAEQLDHTQVPYWPSSDDVVKRESVGQKSFENALLALR